MQQNVNVHVATHLETPGRGRGRELTGEEEEEQQHGAKHVVAAHAGWDGLGQRLVVA